MAWKKRVLSDQQQEAAKQLGERFVTVAKETFPDAWAGAHLESWEVPELEANLREQARTIAFQATPMTEVPDSET